MKKAILFDMDGVITDTEKFYNRAMLERLREEGLDVGPDALEGTAGSTQERTWGIFKERYHLTGNVEDYAASVHAKRNAYAEVEGIHPMPGVIDLIKRVKAAGFRIALASSAPVETIKENMEILGTTDLFDQLVSGTMCEHGKPAPDVYLKAAELLGVEPSDCIVIEDAANGVKAGNTAGMYTIGYAPVDGFKQDLSEAREVVEHHDDLDPEELKNKN